MAETPLLRDALARALEAALLSPLDDPPVPTVDRVLRALANDPDVESSCWTAVMYARRNIASLAATLFGEPDTDMVTETIS